MFGNVLLVIGTIIVLGAMVYSIKKRNKAAASGWVILGIALAAVGVLGNYLAGP